MKHFLHTTPLLVFAMMTLAVTETRADNPTDYFLQNDVASVENDRQDGLLDHYQDHIDRLLDKGYSPASIIMSSVGRGMTLSDVIYMMSRSQPENAKTYYHTAEALLPSMPGWVCSTPNAMGHRYDKPVERKKIEDSRSIQRVASLYFDEQERFVNTPDWQNGVGHINVRTDELIKYKEHEIERVSDLKENPVDSWWYLPQKDNASPVIQVGLYPKERRVLIDARLVELQALAQNGTRTLPVMFMYNDNGHVPISDVELVPGELYGGSTMKQDEVDYIDYDDGEITASEVIKRFETDGDRVPPVRDWKQGDHHLMVRTDELVELFDIPEKDEIDPTYWSRSEQKLNRREIEPLHISLVREAEGERWLDEGSMVSVARERGIERLPVVFFYHGVERQACGMPSACIPDVRAAAEAGSGNPDLFDGSTPDKKPPYSGPPVVVPPVSGPISPN